MFLNLTAKVTNNSEFCAVFLVNLVFIVKFRAICAKMAYRLPILSLGVRVDWQHRTKNTIHSDALQFIVRFSTNRPNNKIKNQSYMLFFSNFGTLFAEY